MGKFDNFRNNWQRILCALWTGPKGKFWTLPNLVFLFHNFVSPLPPLLPCMSRVTFVMEVVPNFEMLPIKVLEARILLVVALFATIACKYAFWEHVEEDFNMPSMSF